VLLTRDSFTATPTSTEALLLELSSIDETQMEVDDPMENFEEDPTVNRWIPAVESLERKAISRFEDP
jgi:hypothetical protein